MYIPEARLIIVHSSSFNSAMLNTSWYCIHIDPTVTVTATGGDAIAGQVFTLMCQASGVTVSGPDDPDLDYSWRRGNTGPELSSFRSYTLAVQVIDAGDDYTCEVTYSPSFLDQSGSVTSFGITTLNVASKLQFIHRSYI